MYGLDKCMYEAHTRCRLGCQGMHATTPALLTLDRYLLAIILNLRHYSWTLA
jgi:hypothetical protein